MLIHRANGGSVTQICIFDVTGGLLHQLELRGGFVHRSFLRRAALSRLDAYPGMPYGRGETINSILFYTLDLLAG